MNHLSFLIVLMLLNSLCAFLLDRQNDTIRKDNTVDPLNTGASLVDNKALRVYIDQRLSEMASQFQEQTENQLKSVEQKHMDLEKEFSSLQTLFQSLMKCYTDLKAENEILKKEPVLQNSTNIDENILPNSDNLEMSKLKQEVRDLEDTVNNLTLTTIAFFKLERNRQQEFQSLHNLTDVMAKNSSRMNEMLSLSVAEIQTKFNKTQALHNFTLNSLQVQINNISAHTQGYKDLRPVATGFTAYRSSAVTVHNHGILKFDKTWTNLDNAYHPNSGIFVAKQAGLYHFSAVLMCNTGDDLYFHIWQNNQAKQGSRAHAVYSSDEHGHNGVTSGVIDVVLDLAVGDRVYIKSNWNDAKVYSDGSNYSTFSGFLI